MFAISRTRWHTRPLSRRAKRRSSAAPGSLRKKYTGIVHPPDMVCSPNHSTTSGDHRKLVLEDLANIKQRPAERFDPRSEPAGEAPLLPKLSQGCDNRLYWRSPL